ncbi:M20/M25/M40 family metallo-hydrolase [Haloglycomyces albus]|uniref:M20/M25/M40 family metallo-hydrolase n=1 Tax=Haloglycomyces albus TaxID=526067 RepID=UPI00046CDD5A|nr:M20/M25/M40 family metallo-hydrolase [Haloglycomyces albus]
MHDNVNVEDEVVGIARDLIRINTTNTGHHETSQGEREAADYVVDKLGEVGVETQIYESLPGRTNVVARLEGVDRSRPALLLHGHLDVVPAEADEWSVDPFAGEIKDGYLWGRGAVDMKDFDAMLIALIRHWKRNDIVPPRDLVFVFTADEEAGSIHGAWHLVREHPEIFNGVSEAVGEVGGFSMQINDDLRAYTVQTAEKGLDWMRLKAVGKPGHGSMVPDDNAVVRLARAVANVGEHRFPVEVTPAVQDFFDSIADHIGMRFDPEKPDEALAKIGPLARIVGATLRNTANPTRLDAGYKTNVIPSTAESVVDCRSLPGRSKELEETIRALIGEGIDIEYEVREPGVETTFDGPLVEAMAESIGHHDPGAITIPYMLSGGTDGKAFNSLGIRCFGFAPLQLPADLDFGALFHGIDERVPVDALQFGVQVMDRFVRRS